MARVEVITGIERRRRWSEDQKREIVAAAFAPGAVVSTVARRADLSTGAIYRWRRELRREMTGFSEVVVAPGVADRGGHSIEVMMGDGVHARIPGSIPPELAAAVVKALVRR
jgi:transposase